MYGKCCIKMLKLYRHEIIKCPQFWFSQYFLPVIFLLSSTVWSTVQTVRSVSWWMWGKNLLPAVVYKSWHENWGAHRDRRVCCWHSKPNRHINTAAGLSPLVHRPWCDYVCSLFRSTALPQIVKLVSFLCQPRGNRGSRVKSVCCCFNSWTNSSRGGVAVSARTRRVSP